MLPTVPDTPAESIFHPSPHIDAVKHPDWSRWKTSKANKVDDQFSDFQILKPSSSTDESPNLNMSILSSTNSSLNSFQSLTTSVTTSSKAASQLMPTTEEKFSLFDELQSSEG